MQTETKTVTQLPIMKYFDDAQLVEKGKMTLDKWRKGEKPIGAVIGLAVIGVGASSEHVNKIIEDGVLNFELKLIPSAIKSGK